MHPDLPTIIRTAKDIADLCVVGWSLQHKRREPTQRRIRRPAARCKRSRR